MLTKRLPQPATAGAAAWFAGVLWIVLVLGTGVLCADRLNAHLGWHWRVVNVRTDTVCPPGAKAWLLHPSRPVAWKQIWPLQIRLISASRTPLIFTPRTGRVAEFPALLFSCDQKGNLMLDPGWQFDPVFRAGLVKLRVPAVLPPALSAGMFMLVVAAGLVLLARRDAAPAQRGPWPRFRTRVQRLLAGVGRRPAGFLSLPSLYFLAVYPPLWKDIDAMTQLIYAVSVSNLFHFPALFCTLARLPMWAGTWVGQPGAFLPFSQQEPTLGGIYTLIACQHAFLIVGLRTFVVTACTTAIWRGVAVLTILLAPSLYAQAQLCGSESWSLIATIFLFASGLRVLQPRPRPWRAWAAYAVALTFAIGSRHINLLLGTWLPGVCLALGAASWRERRRLVYWWVRTGVAGTALVLAVFCNREFAQVLGRHYGIEVRSTLGRTLSDRIGTFLEKLRPEERLQLARHLATKTADPDVQAAVMIQATVGRFYQGGAEALTDFIVHEGVAGERAAAQCDRAELQAMLLYLRSWHPKLLETIRRDMQRGFNRANNENLTISAYGGNFFAAIYAAQKPSAWQSLAVLKSARFPDAAVWFDVASADHYIKLTHRLSVLWLTVVLLAAWALARFRREVPWAQILPFVAMIGAGAVTFLATCVCVFYLNRYALPLFATVWLALAPSLQLACRPRESSAG